jgi:DNA-binding MarR family transcriptional regulator
MIEPSEPDLSDATTSEPRIAAWRLMRDTTQAILTALDVVLKAHDSISVREYRALLLLWNGPRPGLRMADLAAGTALTRSAVTALVDRMERDGLVARAPDLVDRRGTLVALTGRGRETFSAAARVHDEAIADLFSRHVSDSEATTLLAALSRIRSAANLARFVQPPRATIPGGRHGGDT